MDNNLLTTLIIILSFVFLITTMVFMVLWARRRSIGAITMGALFAVFAPDPVMEQTIKLVEEAKEVQTEEDEEGEL